MYLTDEARYVGYATAFRIPLPRAHEPSKRVHDLLMVASLPERVRELYGLTLSDRERRAAAAIARAMRAARPLVPGRLARGYNKRSFELVAKTERRRIERGHETPQVLADGPRPLATGPYLQRSS